MAKDLVCECGRVVTIPDGHDETVCPDCGKVNYRPDTGKARAAGKRPGQRTCPKCYRLAKVGEETCPVCGTPLVAGIAAAPVFAPHPRGAQVAKVGLGLVTDPLRTMTRLAGGRYTERFLVKMVVFFILSLFLTFIPQAIDFSGGDFRANFAPERVLSPVWIFVVNMVAAVILIHLSACVYGGGTDFISAFCLIGFVMVLTFPLAAIPAIGQFLSTAFWFVVVVWYGFMLTLINWKIFQNYLSFSVLVAVLIVMLNWGLEYVALEMIPTLARTMAVHAANLGGIGG